MILNSPEFHTALTDLLTSEKNADRLETLSNLLLPITKLDASVCKGKHIDWRDPIGTSLV